MSDPVRNEITFGSLFAGIGGFDLGFERAGMTCALQAEIDEHANSVRRRHWPDTEHLEDVNDAAAEDAVRRHRPALVCFGFPCQDLSVAGQRRGLAGGRSGLFFRAMELVAVGRPDWVVVENVPGLLSSHDGRDMGAVLGALGELGYGWAYRVFDARYFGVAQRRRRVFVVGRLGDRTGRVLEEYLGPLHVEGVTEAGIGLEASRGG